MIERIGWQGTALDFEGPIAYAHRGGNLVAPENTIAAFEHAVGLGYLYLETDVHLTAGGELVAWHDEVLPDGRFIADLTVQERKAVEVDDGHDIPLLDDLLGTFPDSRFSIDAKHGQAVEAYLKVVRRHDAFGRIVLASFTENDIWKLRSGAPAGTPSAMAESEVFDFWFVCMGLEQETPHKRWSGDIASVPVSTEYDGSLVDVANQAFIDAAHKHGKEVHVWTVNDRDEMESLLDKGVDGIYTDDPALLKEVFEERGLAVS